MAEIVVTKRITLSKKGPVNGIKQLIHLQQGSLDGACGVYSLFMALTICGVIRQADHEQLLAVGSVRKNTATGKALIRLDELSSEGKSLLFRDGLGLPDLAEAAKKYSNLRPIYKESGSKYSTQAIIDIVVKEVSENNNPVILGLHFGDGGHAVVVIGVEYNNELDRKKEKPSRLLLLDPSVPTPIYSAWNSIVDISPRTYTFWNENLSHKVTAFDALILEVKEKK